MSDTNSNRDDPALDDDGAVMEDVSAQVLPRPEVVMSEEDRLRRRDALLAQDTD